MPIEKLDADDAFARALRNRERGYPKVGKGEERLAPFARPRTQPAFSFSPDGKIFATGSCFARNVEKSLHAGGFNTVSSPTDIPVPKGVSNPFQLYNKYTVHSILNELRWALGARDFDPEELVIEGPDGKWYDLQVSASVSGTRNEMIALRKAYNASFAEAAQADIVIMTLGLVECWFDKVTGVYLNEAPSRPMIRAYPDRFEFHLLDYQDILDALREVSATITAARSTPFHFLVTVSPVGLVTTFREQDVLVANCYSKSVQRAAVEAFVAEQDAQYFPSYEYVTLSDRRYAWINTDFRHVRPEMVDRIMGDVLLTFSGPSQGQSFLSARGNAKALREAGAFEEVAEILDAHFTSYPETDEELTWLYAITLRKVGRHSEALDLCRKVIAKGGSRAKSAGKTAINIARQIGEDAIQAQVTEWFRATFPEESL